MMAKTMLILAIMFVSIHLSAQEETAAWFPFKPTLNDTGSRINMKHWLDAPAGKHGFVQMKEDNLVFEDGKGLKFWGVNIASNRPFLPNDEADRWTRFMAAYGINAVRFHKFTWEATDGIHSTRLTKDKWDRFDYFNAALKKEGIYQAWSHIYGHRVLPGDSSRLLAYKEVADTKFPWAHINGSTASIVNFAEDLQALNIELTVNMLNHTNPYTGLRYADDPALACIEMQNEDDIFWSAMEETLKQAPTYRALLCRKFSWWLRNKYATQEALEKAWGKGVLRAGETLLKKNIYPQPNHGFFSAESERAWKGKTTLPQHVTDKASFLASEQMRFYNKFAKAIRKTGYKGLIVGSCWQAGTGIAHLWNLYADAQTGVVDRHNYSGGGTGHTLKPGKIKDEAMVNAPGGGLLSTGFQQVEDRPFFISEWMSLIPNEWTAESAPIVAAYGLGLQGWDGSFAFAMDFDHFTATVQSGHGVYNVTSPTQLALYPALAAMIYRNDIKEGAIIAGRNVSVAGLNQGQLPFFETVEQESDIKNLQSSFPLNTLAAGRVVLSFNEQKLPGSNSTETAFQSVSGTVRANNGQLQWHNRDSGYFTIDTEGTQGFVGFAANKRLQLGDVSLKTTNPFAVVLITSLEKEHGISDASSLLITTIARARNTNMQYNKERTELLNVGEPPVLLEPVLAELSFKNFKRAQLYVLDHSGNRTGATVRPQNGRFLLDGQKHKAIYYELAVN